LHGTGSSSLSEPGRLENAFKSGAFSKRYGFIGRVNGETHRFKNGLARDWLARKVSCSMRFPGHETVSIGNRFRVNAALNKVIIISILLSLFMTTAIYILPSKSFEKTVRTN